MQVDSFGANGSNLIHPLGQWMEVTSANGDSLGSGEDECLRFLAHELIEVSYAVRQSKYLPRGQDRTLIWRLISGALDPAWVPFDEFIIVRGGVTIISFCDINLAVRISGDHDRANPYGAAIQLTLADLGE